MRSLVISALSRPRETSSRRVFMLTGTTSCTMGSTKAPPFITTFCPPSPVRTKARSLDERRYSQFISQTTTATITATAISPRITAPTCAPVMTSLLLGRGEQPSVPHARCRRSSAPDALEFPCRLHQRRLGGQPFHAGGAVETVTPPAAPEDVARVGGAGDGPAVAEHDDVGIHPAGRLRPRVDASHAVLQGERGFRADGAARGEPEVTDHDVRARLGHVRRALLRKDIGGGEEVEDMGGADHLDLEAVAHARLLELGADGAVEKAHGGEVLHPREPQRGQPRQEILGDHEWIGAVDAGEHRRVLDHGQHLARHVEHDVVGIAVGHEAGERAAAGHAVAAGVVDDDEVDAAGLLALGGEARARPAPDDGLAAADHAAEALEDVRTRDARHGYLAPAAATGSREISPNAATRASTNSGSFTLCGSRTIWRLDVARTPEVMASKSVLSAAGSQKGLPGASMRETPPSGMRKRTGPSMRLSLSAMNRPMRAHSSGVVRIRVTLALWR